jgi:hypothetical protein
MLIFKYPYYQARLKIVGIFALTTIVTISALLLSIAASDVFGATERTTYKAISIKEISTTENTTESPLLAAATARLTKLQVELKHLEETAPKFDFQAISKQLKEAAIADRAVRDPADCNGHLSDFILPAKESRFIVLYPCVGVSGTVTSSKYFNDDGDASFNIVLDPPYNQNILSPGNLGPSFALKYQSRPALHVEVICQGPITSTRQMDVGACNGYNGPNFKPILPHRGDHVQVIGRYLIEPPEIPRAITEIHPVTDIKILPTTPFSPNAAATTSAAAEATALSSSKVSSAFNSFEGNNSNSNNSYYH